MKLYCDINDGIEVKPKIQFDDNSIEYARKYANDPTITNEKAKDNINKVLHAIDNNTKDDQIPQIQPLPPAVEVLLHQVGPPPPPWIHWQVIIRLSLGLVIFGQSYNIYLLLLGNFGGYIYIYVYMHIFIFVFLCMVSYGVVMFTPPDLSEYKYTC